MDSTTHFPSQDLANAQEVRAESGIFDSKSVLNILKLTAEEAVKKFPEQAGIARYGEPEQIAGLMAHLASKEARWFTGASIRMDGGEIKGNERLLDLVNETQWEVKIKLQIVAEAAVFLACSSVLTCV